MKYRGRGQVRWTRGRWLVLVAGIGLGNVDAPGWLPVGGTARDRGVDDRTANPGAWDGGPEQRPSGRAWAAGPASPGGTTSAEPAPVVLDRILVVVNGQPITRSRLEFYRTYLEHTRGLGLGWPRAILNAGQLAPEAMLEVVVTDELLFEGAGRVEALRVRERAITARIEAFRSSFASAEACQDFMRRFELTPDALREFFVRRLRVEGYIELKVGSERPSDAELQDFYNSHAATWSAQPFETVREQLAAILYQSRASGRFDAWIAEQRGRANVQVPARGPE